MFLHKLRFFCILKPSCNICMWRKNFDLIPIFTAVTFFMLLKQHVVNESHSEIATSTTISWIRSYTHNQVDRHNTLNCMWIMNYFFGYCICVIKHRYYSPYSSLRQCVIRRQFACSIADEIIQIFYCIFSFRPHCGLWQKWVSGISPGGCKADRYVRLTILPNSYAERLLILGDSNSWSPTGLSRP